MWRRWGFFRQFKLNLIRLTRIQESSDAVARGMALGLFIGMTPTFGVQMPLALLFSWLLRESKVAALIGVWNTNPLTAPFIYGLEYEIGRSLLGTPHLTLNFDFGFSALFELGWQVMAPIWVGSLVLGVPVALIGYALTLRFIPSMRNWRISRWPRRRKELNVNGEK
jgi:uncharacterized protein